MNNKKAFTLIELVVTMSIMVIFTALLFRDYGKDSKIFALERMLQRTAQDLRRTQEMATSALSLDGETGTTGYGIYFNKAPGSKTTYVIYRNVNANPYYDSGVDAIKETVNMEKGIEICDIKNNGVSLVAGYISVSFAPPDPINYIEGQSFGQEASIVLCTNETPPVTRTVKINNAGRIETTNP